MNKLSPRTELLLAATQFTNALDALSQLRGVDGHPLHAASLAEKLAFAAENYLTWPAADVSLKYSLQLGYAAQAVTARSARDWPAAIKPLREILQLALKEGRAEEGDAAAMAAGLRQWQQRADLQ